MTIETYQVELTDTFGGEANYAWVKRAFIRVDTKNYGQRERTSQLTKHAKKAMGLTGVPGDPVDLGDYIEWRPRGSKSPRGSGACIVMFIQWHDCPHNDCPCKKELGEANADASKPA